MHGSSPNLPGREACGKVGSCATPPRSAQSCKPQRLHCASHTMASALLFAFSGLYVTWGVLQSKALFHRVWSLALFFFLLLTYQLCILPASIYTILLSVIDLLLFSLCVALSPAQLILFRHDTSESNFKRLDELTKGSPDKVVAELVHPFPYSRFFANRTIISISVIAVHGLASNPQTTWRTSTHVQQDVSLVSTYSESTTSTAPHRSSISPESIWLRDFLPQEGLRVRVIMFNHNTAWEANALSKSLDDYGEDLLGALCDARTTDEVRMKVMRGASSAILMIGST